MSSNAAKFARFGSAIAIVVLALGYLAYSGLKEENTMSYYKTIGELKGMGDDAYAKRLRVAGNVVPGTIKRRGTHLQFQLVEQGNVLNVEYTGSEAPPDTFKDDAQALADGTYGRDGVFHAKQIQAKCASKYAPAPASQTAGTQSAPAGMAASTAAPGTK